MLWGVKFSELLVFTRVIFCQVFFLLPTDVALRCCKFSLRWELRYKLLCSFFIVV